MPSTGKATYHFFPSLEEASQAAAERLTALIGAHAAKKRAPFRLVLAGGSTPERLYRLLAAAPFATQIAWPRVRFFWGDERFVPRSDPASNYRLAAATLLDPLQIPSCHRFPIPVAGHDPEACAARYEAMVRGWRDHNGLLFDCVLLGMGPDGHTLSLFPGRPAVERRDRLVVAEPEPVGRPAVERITLTLTAVAASRWVMFLVAGAEKCALVEQIRSGSAAALPAGRIVCLEESAWFVGRKH